MDDARERHRFHQLEGERIEECFLMPEGLLLRFQHGLTVLVRAVDGGRVTLAPRPP